MFKILGVLVPILFLMLPCTGAKVKDERFYKYDNGTRAAILISEAQLSGGGCPPGHVEYKKSPYCLPYCESQCPGGFCIAPNECDCDDDKLILPDGQCQDTCPGDCLNGVCSGFLKKKCKCNPGFELDESELFCMRMCNPGCGENEVCNVIFGKCECDDDFTWDNVTNSCIGVCKEDCLNGICNRVGKCECHKGFTLKDGVCQANCWMDCTNGRCVSENKCKCKEGYLISIPSLKCMPHCAEPCGRNKICAAPNTCTCKPGFIQTKLNMCVPPGGFTSKKPKPSFCRGSRCRFRG